MAYVQFIPVRFQDVDFARIVYYPRLFDYCHRAFEDFFANEVGIPYAAMLSEQKVGYPTVHAEGDFKAPLRFGDSCRVELSVERLSGRSITCRYHLYRGESDLLCASFTIVVAAVDMDTFRPVEVPPQVREAMQRHALG